MPINCFINHSSTSCFKLEIEMAILPIASFFFLINLFLAVLGLCSCTIFLQLWQAGATLHCNVQSSHCSGFFCCRACALGMQASVVVAHRLSSCGLRGLEHRLSSCDERAQLLRTMWDLPRPGLEPMSPALVGGVLTTAPPGKPYSQFNCLKGQFLELLKKKNLNFLSQQKVYQHSIQNQNVVFYYS